MNRYWSKQSGRGLSLLVLAAALVLAFGLLADVAIAGDSEGISGYSMRLKNKDFVGNESGTGSQSSVDGEISTRLEVPTIETTNRSSIAANSFLLKCADWLRLFWLVNSR